MSRITISEGWVSTNSKIFPSSLKSSSASNPWTRYFVFVSLSKNTRKSTYLTPSFSWSWNKEIGCYKPSLVLYDTVREIFEKLINLSSLCLYSINNITIYYINDTGRYTYRRTVFQTYIHPYSHTIPNNTHRLFIKNSSHKKSVNWSTYDNRVILSFGPDSSHDINNRIQAVQVRQEIRSPNRANWWINCLIEEAENTLYRNPSNYCSLPPYIFFFCPDPSFIQGGPKEVWIYCSADESVVRIICFEMSSIFHSFEE